VRALRLLAVVASLLLSSCGGTPLRSSAVIGWALGSDQLTGELPAGDRWLVVLPMAPPFGRPQGVLPKCVSATGFLPAPAPDPRIFLQINGQIYVRRAPGEEPVLLSGSDPALGLTRLLAFDKHASPLEMLVAAKPEGAATEQLWQLTLEERAIKEARLITLDRGFPSQEAFFAAYNAPRCLEGGLRCLSSSFDGQASYVDVEEKRGQSRVTLQKLGEVRVADLAWAAPDGSSLYLLVPCR
jgi:hypothetical protein